jgi:hypothetical protein
MTKLQSGHECVYLLTLFVKLRHIMILTFEVGTWFLDATHRLDVVDICTKLFQNPSMYDKVTVQTRMNWRRTDGRSDRQTAVYESVVLLNI